MSRAIIHVSWTSYFNIRHWIYDSFYWNICSTLTFLNNIGFLTYTCDTTIFRPSVSSSTNTYTCTSVGRTQQDTLLEHHCYEDFWHRESVQTLVELIRLLDHEENLSDYSYIESRVTTQMNWTSHLNSILKTLNI